VLSKEELNSQGELVVVCSTEDLLVWQQEALRERTWVVGTSQLVEVKMWKGYQYIYLREQGIE
jgi:hypothetical protein